MDFSAFDTSKLDEYAAQSKELWGKTDAYKEFEEKSKNWTEDTSKNIAKDIHKTITIEENLDISYSYVIKENISIKQDLEQSFEKSIEKELELGYTSIGPHRDDIIFKINDLDCKHYASQGQQRTVALVVKLSLMEVIREEIGEYPILLLDDVLSELDSARQERLLKLTTNYQTFISCTSIPTTTLPYNKKEIKNGKVLN